MGTTAREPARGRPARFACKLNRVWGLPGDRVGAGEHQCGQRTLRLAHVASILPGGAVSRRRGFDGAQNLVVVALQREAAGPGLAGSLRDGNQPSWVAGEQFDGPLRHVLAGAR